MNPTAAGGRASRRQCPGRDRRTERPVRAGFEVTPEILSRLAAWRGNAAAVQRELVQQSNASASPAPSLATLQRALRTSIGASQGRDW